MSRTWRTVLTWAWRLAVLGVLLWIALLLNSVIGTGGVYTYR